MLQIFAIDIKTGERFEITNFYWFEENGIHTLTGDTVYSNEFNFELFINGEKVWESNNAE